MQLKSFITATRRHFDRWFHPRNVIIVSPHKVKHMSVGPLLQFGLLLFCVSCLSWAAYSTGSYFAARHALKEQSQTLRSVVISRSESVNPLYLLAPPITGKRLEADESNARDPMFTVSALGENKMAVKVAELEKKLKDLQTANNDMIEQVRIKTAGRMGDLENIIRATGLKPDTLKKQMGEGKNSKNKAQGGPFIPDNINTLLPEAQEMFVNLDQMALLDRIIEKLPLAAPIKNAEEESGFGHRSDPFTGHLAFHSGLDLAGANGAEIYATAAGKVVAAGRNGAYGNAIDIDHGFGIVTRYGHLSRIIVQEGQLVKKGEAIGAQGSTGRSTGAHLHYEVRYNDEPMNPKKFLTAGAHVLEE